jgi:hypothetical protein
MSFAKKKRIVLDPNAGVAPVSVATSVGRPGGHVLTEADIPELLGNGTPLDEIATMQLTSLERLEEIALGMVSAGKLSPERFSFKR